MLRIFVHATDPDLMFEFEAIVDSPEKAEEKLGEAAKRYNLIKGAVEQEQAEEEKKNGGNPF